MTKRALTFLEFFAGGGMARLGLGDRWHCAFANDIDPMKCAAYRENFGEEDLVEGSIADLKRKHLPKGRMDLAWASFPCQDLSLAGARSGMSGERSGMFYAFWRLMKKLHDKDRAPRLIVLENVPGLVSSNEGEDLAAIFELMKEAGYVTATGVIDGAAFTPQSRQRLFIVGFAADIAEGAERLLERDENGALVLPQPTHKRNVHLDDIIDWDADDWDSEAKTQHLLSRMSPLQRGRLDAIVESGARRAGAGFHRTRHERGQSVQRFEARFDGVAGCLRTPAGGSSRQIVVAIDNGTVRTRLMSPREAARLMGLPEDYKLPERTNAALKLCGDGVCAPVVSWLAQSVLEPALKTKKKKAKAA